MHSLQDNLVGYPTAGKRFRKINSSAELFFKYFIKTMSRLLLARR